MAHAVHLEDEEIELFRQTGASIAHCPASNTMLSSGLCDVRRLLNAGIKVGLGTGKNFICWNFIFGKCTSFNF